MSQGHTDPNVDSVAGSRVAASEAVQLISLPDSTAGPEMIRRLLREVIDPEIGVNIVDLGLLYGVQLSTDGVVAIRMTLTTPGCPLGGYIEDEIQDVLYGVPGVTGIEVAIVWDPPWDPHAMMSDRAKEQLGWRR